MAAPLAAQTSILMGAETATEAYVPGAQPMSQMGPGCAARPLPPSADIGPGGQSVGQAAQFCFSATLAMPPDTGNMISFIRFRSGTKSMPVPQQSERKFQIVLDVPAAV